MRTNSQDFLALPKWAQEHICWLIPANRTYLAGQALIALSQNYGWKIADCSGIAECAGAAVRIADAMLARMEQPVPDAVIDTLLGDPLKPVE